MGTCQICKSSSAEISSNLGVCLNCIRNRPEEAREIAMKRHADSRAMFGLPPSPPRDPDGLSCGVCMNECKIGPGKKGYCGLVYNINGRLVRYGGTPEKGILEWYYDSLPTNCVSWSVCAGCTGAGYPKYAYTDGPEIGYYNLAVFYGTCSLDCLYCQNWHWRANVAKFEPAISAEELAMKVRKDVSCICYFGGDPSPQMPHAIRTSEIAYEQAKKEGRKLRICWETNGYIGKGFLDKAVKLSLESGGTIKFDLKCFDENLNLALCGVSNKPTLRNFEEVGRKYFRERLSPPLLVASTLLVPGYVDAEEVKGIAEFIASIDPEIPYILLAFYPCYMMDDLPTTRKEHAYECLNVAKKAGLKHVRIGNIHLLS